MRIPIGGICRFYDTGGGFCLYRKIKAYELGAAETTTSGRTYYRHHPELEEPSLAQYSRKSGFLRDIVICTARGNGGAISEEVAQAQRQCSCYEKGPTRKRRIRIRHRAEN